MHDAINETMALLAAVILLAYLFCNIGRRKLDLSNQPGEIRRATQVALQLESIADELRQDLARHRSRVERFKSQLADAAAKSDGELDETAWQQLEGLAEDMMGPTLQLGGQLSGAYDKIRRQTQSLANFTGGRLDRQTGLGNGKALEEHLTLLLEQNNESDTGFALAMLSVSSDDTTPGDSDTAERLQDVADLLRHTLRQSDFAARYGIDEIVVVMPGASSEGARVFGDRFRRQSQDELGILLCCGLAESRTGDSAKSVLKRADSALYSARAAGAGRQYAHSGGGILPADAQDNAAADATEPATSLS